MSAVGESGTTDPPETLLSISDSRLPEATFLGGVAAADNVPATPGELRFVLVYPNTSPNTRTVTSEPDAFSSSIVYADAGAVPSFHIDDT